MGIVFVTVCAAQDEGRGDVGRASLKEATPERSRIETENLVQAAVRFFERWKELRP